MAGSSPRWPSKKGPGLDFAPYRKGVAGASAVTVDKTSDGAKPKPPASAKPASDTPAGQGQSAKPEPKTENKGLQAQAKDGAVGQRPKSADQGAGPQPQVADKPESGEPKKPGAGPQPQASKHPAQPKQQPQGPQKPQSPQNPQGKGGPQQGKPGESGKGTKMSKARAERVAKAAQEWDATPVAASAKEAPAEATAKIVTSPTTKITVAPVSPANPTASPGSLTPADTAASSSTGPNVTALATGGDAKPDPTKRSRRTRKARLRLARIDPWSVMKTTFLFAIAFGVMLWVVVAVIWSVLAGTGALDSLSEILTRVFSDSDTPIDVTQIISPERVLGFAALIAVIDVVIITAVTTLVAFLYNLAATIMGGLEITLAED